MAILEFVLPSDAQAWVSYLPVVNAPYSNRGRTELNPSKEQELAARKSSNDPRPFYLSGLHRGTPTAVWYLLV